MQLRRRSRARVALALVVAASVASGGCATMIFHNPQDVVVTTNASGAFIRGHGRVPGNVQVDRSKDHALLVEAEGYEPATLKLRSQFSWWRILVSVVLNGGHGLFTLFITTAIGCAVDAGSGSWQVIAEDDVNVQLERKTFQASGGALEPKPAEGSGNGTPAPGATEAGSSSRGQPVAGASAFCTECGERLPSPDAKSCTVCGAQRRAPAGR